MLHLKTLIMVTLTATTAANTVELAHNASVPPLRQEYHIAARHLHLPVKSGGHHSSYKGCLGYSDSELVWIFPGQAPNCSWLHSGDSSGSDSNSGSGGGSISSSSGGSNGGSYGFDDGGNGNEYWAYEDYRGHGGGNGQGDNSGYDDEQIISNEDIYDGNSDYDPIDDFDIEKCNTYENLWLWDLSLSCNMTAGDISLSGCNCTFAEELMDDGLLTCDDAALCPSNCIICSTCLKLLGCGTDPNQPGMSRSMSTAVVLYVVGAAVALLIFGLASYYARRKWQDHNNLNRSLIEKRKNRMIDIEDGPGFMYINGDLTWKPLPSDQQYAAAQIQPVCTMSTASSGKYLEERIQPSSGGCLSGASEEDKESCSNGETSSIEFGTSGPEETNVPTVVETLNDIENRALSPIPQTGKSSMIDSPDDQSYVFEDAIQSPTSSREKKQKSNGE
ncbi:unnamed protein product [Pseudo-nitzschia multistriata]|uniref:Uncharacterized protein n=1 Tax=Pseudo-nitzschia multistriata TaxID=183589 RepID=A0A448YUD3_9STRA|nr:unnamed protein product [Pseudo-nitzschia multistriata]